MIEDRCVAAPDHHWSKGRVHRINEDGTYTIEFDEKEMDFMPYWYGVTQKNLSFNEEAIWPALFEQLSSADGRMDLITSMGGLTRAGYEVDQERLSASWREQCQKLFSIDSEQPRLDREQAYRMLLRLGLSAKALAAPDETEADYQQLYWNQIRMGGRDPQELSRSVTLEDAFRALGIPSPVHNEQASPFLEAFEAEHDVRLPDDLRRLFLCKGIRSAVLSAHPNEPELAFPGTRWTQLELAPEVEDGGAECALPIMTSHQGGHRWGAVFDRGDPIARICVRWGNAPWLLTAPSVGMFIWDLAQTGLAWYQVTQHDGGRPIEKTDIGAIPRAEHVDPNKR